MHAAPISAAPEAQNRPLPEAVLLFSDGTELRGIGIGKLGVTAGEVCFNTAMTGYQEILTDPSYAGQLVTFTFPHIGIVGCNGEDIESEHFGAAGLILREVPDAPSNWRSAGDLQSWLERKGIGGIAGIDTRALTRKVRTQGAQNIVIASAPVGQPLPMEDARKLLAATPNMAGRELACGVSTGQTYGWSQTAWKLERGYGTLGTAKKRVIAFDFGEKLNILRLLADQGCEVTVVPATTSAADIIAQKPDGVFLSNGPGDPAATATQVLPALKEIVAAGVPTFGICLGHQLLALAVGGRTEKMPQGHRGANHPVKRLRDGKVEITAQNHGFAVAHGSLPANAELTHLSLFDGTIQGFRLTDKPVFSVQYHPESSPGPHDSRYLFQDFIELMDSHAQTH